MQSIVESLCRCFGSTPINQDLMDMESLSLAQSAADVSRGQGGAAVPQTPDMKRRTRSLALQDKQWDALFNSEPKHQRARSSASGGNNHVSSFMEQAHAVAKAKLAANPPRPSRVHKRKRSSSSSRDDIFRNRKQNREDSVPDGAASPPNPLSRFLSNHPVIAQTLCFASPVKDSQEPDELPLNASDLVSDTNTLNTAEDTITSTLYYETTKLAGLSQKNPPMPLFNNFCVDERDDIHRIVASHSHSSTKLMGMKSVQTTSSQREVVQTPDARLDEVPPMTSSSSSHSHSTKSR